MDMDFFFLTRDDTTDADTVRTDSFVRISAAHNNTCKAVVRFGGLDSLDSGLHGYMYHRIALGCRSDTECVGYRRLWSERVDNTTLYIPVSDQLANLFTLFGTD